MNPYEVCEDFFIWIRTKYFNVFMMILLIWILTNPYKVCAIMQQRGDQSRSRPSSPSSSLFSKTFLLFTRIQMHKEIFGGNYKEFPAVGQFFVDFSTELLQSTWLVDQSGNWNSLVRGGQISNDYYGTNKQNHTETCISKLSHWSCAKFGGKERPVGNNFQ